MQNHYNAVTVQTIDAAPPSRRVAIEARPPGGGAAIRIIAAD